MCVSGNALVKIIQKHNVALDGLRGFAALIVLFGHAQSYFGVNDGMIKIAARSGVYVFFILSAYLLTKQFFDARLSRAALPGFLNNYFYRRVVRILPLYVLATTGYFSVVLVFPNSRCVIFNLNQYVEGLTLYEARGHFWTIPVEFTFYFVLPVLAITALDLRGKYFYLIVGVLCILSDRLLHRSGGEFIPNIYLFMPGVCAAKIVSEHPEFLISKFMKIGFDLFGLGALLCFFILTPILENLGGYSYQDVESLSAWSLLSVVILLAILNGEGLMRCIFEIRPLRFLGKISYSAYLWHIFVYAVFNRIFPNWTGVGGFLVALVVLTGFSYLSWRYIEMTIYRSGLLQKYWSQTVGRWL